jgi:hypothetical protein
MADSLNSPTLSKLHQALSRRSLMCEMAVGAAIVAVPVSVMAAPVPTPRERLKALIEELKIAAREANPTICDWKVSVADRLGELGCAVLIAAFERDEVATPTSAAIRRRKRP